jgi:Fe2+ transport system protein B
VSTVAEVFNFALRESRAAVLLYFEPVQWLLRSVLSKRRGSQDSTSSHGLQPVTKFHHAKTNADRMMTIAVFGFTGSGKTTLIMELMGARESHRFGASPDFEAPKRYAWRDNITIVDAPGIGNLLTTEETEERVVNQLIYGESDFILLVLDAGSRFNEGDLFRAHRFLEAGKPVLVLLSRADLVPEREMVTRLKAIESRMGVAPVPFSTHTGLNVQKVRDLLLSWSRGSSVDGSGSA